MIDEIANIIRMMLDKFANQKQFPSIPLYSRFIVARSLDSFLPFLNRSALLRPGGVRSIVTPVITFNISIQNLLVYYNFHRCEVRHAIN